MARQAENSVKKRSQLRMIWHQFKKNKLALVGLIVFLFLVFVAVFAPVIVSYEDDVITMHMVDRLQSPNAEHWFGTDQSGRDLFARVLWGARISLSVGLCVVAASLAMGGIIGGGGLGKIAINYGYYRYMYLVMYLAVILLIILVQIFQSVGTRLSVKSDKRLKGK